MNIKLSEKTTQKILEKSSALLACSVAPAKQAASLIGLLQYSTIVIPQSPLYYRALMISLIAETKENWNTLVPINQAPKADLIWWTQNLLKLNQKSLIKTIHSNPKISTVDASNIG